MTEFVPSAVALRFLGDELNPLVETQLLGHRPTLFGAKGQAGAKTGFWILQADSNSAHDLNDQVINIISKLSLDLSSWKYLTSNFIGDIFCGIFAQSADNDRYLNAVANYLIRARGLVISCNHHFYVE